MFTLTIALALAAAPPGIAVMDFAPEGASPEMARATAGLVAQELERLQVFRVTSTEATRLILGMERQRQLLGCDTCTGNVIADLASFEYLVTGKLTRTAGNQYLLTMTLLKAGDTTQLSSVKVNAAGEDRLLQEVPPATIRLLGKLLQDRQGKLYVSASEVGAEVKADDVLLGTTPLEGPLALGAGPHLLSVEKEGFSAVRREVRISPGAATEEVVRLVPSPDTILAYEARASRLRVLAWTGTALAVAGLGTFAGTTIAANNLYGDDQISGTFQYHRSFLIDGVESADGVDHRARATDLKSQIETLQIVGFVSLGLAAVGAATGLVLFIVGDPPGKYDAYKDRTRVTGPTVQLVPSAGGLAAVGTF